MKNTIFTLLLLAALSAHRATAQQQRDRQQEQVIETQLQNSAPSSLAAFKAATIAMDEQNYPLADSLYTLVCRQAPDFDPAIRRLGGVKTALGEVNEGIELCEKAIELNRSPVNLIALAFCLTHPRDGNAEALNEDLKRALILLQEGRDLPEADELEYNALIAQTALQLNDTYAFTAATKILLARHKDQMVTHYFGAILAATNEDWETAEREIRIAHKMGLPAADMNNFLNSGVKKELESEADERDRWATVRQFGWIVLWWLCGFALLFIVGRALSFYTMRSIEQQLRTGDFQSGRTLRRIYKTLISAAGFYYYISLPVVLIVIVALAGIIVYTFITIGHLPIKFLLILIIGVGITVFGMLRSLFVKADDTEPGRRLNEEEAPELYALTREVAATMGTRPIDEIRITPHTDLAVYETGSWRAKLRDEGKRILIVGTGILKDFRVNDFRAVLAHEYGHFTNRDTAGGGLALRVERDMTNYYIALYHAGQAVWWNAGFLFLRFYHFIFRRISAGATRLQEVLADRVAAQTYGYEPFRSGLTFVIRKNIDFTVLANNEIKDAENNKRPYSNLYELTGNPGPDAERELQQALNRKTSEEDTHPGPADRFRYVEGFGNTAVPETDRSVNELFTGWHSLTEEMTDIIRRIVAMNKQPAP